MTEQAPGRSGVTNLEREGEIAADFLEKLLDIADLDTAVLGVVEDLVVEVGVVQERLGGDAADVQAGSAEGAALLDTGDLCAC